MEEALSVLKTSQDIMWIRICFNRIENKLETLKQLVKLFKSLAQFFKNLSSIPETNSDSTDQRENQFFSVFQRLQDNAFFYENDLNTYRKGKLLEFSQTCSNYVTKLNSTREKVNNSIEMFDFLKNFKNVNMKLKQMEAKRQSCLQKFKELNSLKSQLEDQISSNLENTTQVNDLKEKITNLSRNILKEAKDYEENFISDYQSQVNEFNEVKYRELASFFDKIEQNSAIIVFEVLNTFLKYSRADHIRRAECLENFRNGLKEKRSKMVNKSYCLAEFFEHLAGPYNPNLLPSSLAAPSNNLQQILQSNRKFSINSL